MKVVINKCFGGFSISRECAEYMASKGSERAKLELQESTTDKWYGYGSVDGLDGYEYDRNDPLLVQAVEALGEKADGNYARLKVVEIPDGIK